MSKHAKNTTTFGQVRSLLQQPPSDEAWSNLVRALRHWPRENIQQLDNELIRYCQSYVATWPDALQRGFPPGTFSPPRKAGGKKLSPAGRLELAIDQDHPVFTLINALDLTSIGANVESLLVLIRRGIAEQIRHLVLSQCQVNEDMLAALSQAPEFSNLVTLDLSKNDLTNDHLEVLLSGSAFSKLEVLNLSENKLTTGTLSMIDRVESLSSLRQLYVRSNSLHPKESVLSKMRERLGKGFSR